MINLKQRSYQKELLDGDDIPFEDIKQNMRELNKVNSLLGGHNITLEGIRQSISAINKNTPVLICEIGCGGGDNLHAINTWCQKKNITARFIGIDIKQTCIDYASRQYPGLKAAWICSDYALADLSVLKPDIIFSSLFCHHFTEPELVNMVGWMRRHSKVFFINDVHRHSLAYYSIKILTRLFSKSYLVKHDAPLSVARGFKKKEWQSIFSTAHINTVSIRWKWAFRHLIVCRNGQ